MVIYDMKDSSYRNLKYIRQWFLFYNQEGSICQQAVGKLGEEMF